MGVLGWGGNVTVYVEADFSEATGPIGSSTPITVDTLWDTDYWDDPTATWESTETLTWTDITEWVQGISTNHGFSRQTTRFNCSTATVRLVNTDGRFSPSNVNSPYRLGDSTTIGVLRPFRIRAEWVSFGVTKSFPLFTGLIQSWNLAYDYNRNAIVNVELLGIESQIASFDQPATTSQGAGETSGERIDRVLTAANWQGIRYIDIGETTVQATTLEGNALSELQLTADSEGGAIYWGPDGAAYFDGYNAQIEKGRTTPQFFFSESDEDLFPTTGGQLLTLISRIVFSDLTFSYNGDLVRNIYNWERVGGTTQRSSNSKSRQLYGDRSDTRTDLICETDGQVRNLIKRELAVNVAPELRVETLKFSPLHPRNTDDYGQPGGRVWTWFDQELLGLRQGTFVYFKPPGETDYVETDVFIDSISHDITPTGWEITLGFSSATVYFRMASSLWDTGTWDTAVWSW